jgi:hypothetical protein
MTATPGPYKAAPPDKLDGWFEIVTADGRYVASVPRHDQSSEAEDTATLLAASWDLHRLLARIVERNRTPDDVADPDVVEARRLLREIGI